LWIIVMRGYLILYDVDNVDNFNAPSTYPPHRSIYTMAFLGLVFHSLHRPYYRSYYFSFKYKK